MNHQWWSNAMVEQPRLFLRSTDHILCIRLGQPSDFSSSCCICIVCTYSYFDLQRFLYLSIASKGSANHQNKKEFSSYLRDFPSTWHLSVQKVFTFAHFFCLPGKKFPACCRKLVAVPIKPDHLGHEWGWVATEIAFHENFATKMNSSINKQSAFKDWYRAKLFGTIALASSPPLRLKSAT